MTSKSPVKSPYKHWMATGSNESYIHIVDLSNILDSEQNTEPVVVTASKRGLDGHFGRITGVMWSPHIDGQLASVSYDGQARVCLMITLMFWFK
ncbi:hypothetical protein KUTeg_024294 [Tegillarca granosa]|uniref:Uncharacterized protein n=1 Tax=Tegillarca granosa TaxID=220873 RepID=A0ABQ9E394_TEGGR|nr:hypothetical protein KUTeg_024294 [Tegillarca granosa]